MLLLLPPVAGMVAESLAVVPPTALVLPPVGDREAVPALPSVPPVAFTAVLPPVAFTAVLPPVALSPPVEMLPPAAGFPPAPFVVVPAPLQPTSAGFNVVHATIARFRAVIPR